MFTEIHNDFDLPLHNVIHNTHWTSPIAETFGSTDVSTHLHFYCDKETARDVYASIKHLIPSTILTVSFK